MSKRHWLLLLIGLLHLLHIVLVNLTSAWAGYKQLYHVQDETGRYHILAKILSPKPIRLYGLISGTTYGYGFFAPNVASQYISSFQYFDKDGVQIGSCQLPPLVGGEALQRYSTWLDQFQRYLKTYQDDDQAAQFYRRYLEASLSSLTQHLLEEQEKGTSLRCVIYLHEPTKLREVKQKARLRKIYERCITKQENKQ
jgi:hypothetical protein